MATVILNPCLLEDGAVTFFRLALADADLRRVEFFRTLQNWFSDPAKTLDLNLSATSLQALSAARNIFIYAALFFQATSRPIACRFSTDFAVIISGEIEVREFLRDWPSAGEIKTTH